MLPITKGVAPRSLQDAIRRVKTTPDATLSWGAFDGQERKAVLRELLNEQGHLCAYCTRRISEETAHVEHVIPQSYGAGSDDENSVDYQNMLAVCDGFKGSDAGLTCDRARGNAPLTVNPLHPETLRDIRYLRDGKIGAAQGADATKKDLKTLNLNQGLLVKNRREAYARLIKKLDALGRRRGEGAVTSYCDRYVKEHLSHPDERVPYDGIIIYFMRKRLRRAG